MEKKAWKYLSVALEANLKNAAIQAHLSVIDRRKKNWRREGLWHSAHNTLAAKAMADFHIILFDSSTAPLNIRVSSNCIKLARKQL